MMVGWDLFIHDQQLKVRGDVMSDIILDTRLMTKDPIRHNPFYFRSGIDTLLQQVLSLWRLSVQRCSLGPWTLLFLKSLIIISLFTYPYSTFSLVPLAMPRRYSQASFLTLVDSEARLSLDLQHTSSSYTITKQEREKENAITEKKSLRFKIAVAMICLASVLVSMDSVIVAAALPAITVDLGGSSLKAFWVGTSYLLAQTVRSWFQITGFQ